MTQANPAPVAPSLGTWRAQVEKELGGASFEKALVHTTAEGLAIQPLYVDGPAPAAVPRASGTFGVIMRHDAALGPVDGDIDDDLGGGADGLWLAGAPALLAARSGIRTSTVVLQDGDAAALAALDGRVERLLLGADPIGARAAGRTTAPTGPIDLAGIAPLARRAADGAGTTAALVSTLPYHRAGADAADELAIALSTGAAYLGALVDAGIDVAAAAGQIAVQIAVGRDTFLELAKLRALRIVWAKLTIAAGAPALPLTVHAVSSPRTLTERDPWVNMLRVTTQVFAAVLGGADLVTPASFDEALGPPSPLGRRTARNTALVLREESHLGRVVDPAAGSYYLESVTDAQAREAWTRFQALEREGGVASALASGALAARLDAAWKKRVAAIGKRREPITGVSEFANLDEAHLPRTPLGVSSSPAAAPALPQHRDAEPFEALRTRVDALGVRAPDVLLLTLGPPAEHRGRAGYATAFFATAGLRTRESTVPAQAAIAVLCGSDERYATEAADAARALREAGAGSVVLAGRPGALEAALREAGVGAFIFVGCDVAATLNDLIGGAP
jgi:methylmalonyl-CoA mutase